MVRVRAALVAVVGLLALPAHAQTPPPRPLVHVRIQSISPWNDAETPFRFEIEVTNDSDVPIQGARVLTTIYQRVLSRSSLRASLDGRPQTGVLAAYTEEIADALEPGRAVSLAVERDLGRFSSAFRARRTPSSGVYPIEIRVGGADRELWSGYSALVFFSQPPTERLNATWVLPLHQPAMFGANGAYDAGDVDRALGPGGTLAAALHRANTDVPVTLAPSGLLVDQLSDLADGFTRTEQRRTVESSADDAVPRAAAASLGALKELVARPGVEIASTPYARADVVALVHGDLSADVGRQLTVGEQAVTRHAGRSPAADVFVPAGLKLDSRSAATVAGFGVRTVVLDPQYLPPASRRGPFAPERPVSVSGRRGVLLNALLADDGIRHRLELSREPAGGDPVLLAQGALADTASAWHERPTLADGRSIVIATATTPPADVVRVLAGGLRSAPWLRMRTASDLVNVVPPEEDPIPLPLGNAGPAVQMETLRTARRAIEILSRIIVSPDGPAFDLDRLVLAAESADWGSSNGGLTLARAAKAEAGRIVGKIETAARRVTLTSRTGQLPVTVFNQTGYVVKVRVLLSSSKVAFPEGSDRTLEVAGRSETITVPAKALATGAFGVRIELRTPDGTFPIGDDELVVRSTAVSAVALIIVGGGIVVLLAAWFGRGGRRRGMLRRRARSRATSGESAQPA